MNQRVADEIYTDKMRENGIIDTSRVWAVNKQNGNIDFEKEPTTGDWRINKYT